VTFEGNLGTFTTTVEPNATLTAAAAVLSGKIIQGPGAVVVSGDVGANTDLTTISAPLNFGDDTAIQVTAGTLTLTAAQATGVGITGAGNVAVTALNATDNANLSTIRVTGTRTATVSEDVTFTGNLGTFTTTVVDGKTLTADASVIDGKIIQGPGAVVVSGDVGANTDLTTISAPLNFGADTAIEVTAGTLTLTAAQANSVNISGVGNVAVTALDASPNANLSGIQVTGTRTATVSNDVTFTGNLGTVTTTVIAGKTLTADASVVDGKKIEGDGAVVVTDSMANYSFANISTDLDISSATGTPTSLPTLIAGQELRVTAAQMTAFAAAVPPVPIGGVGDVTVELPGIQTAGLNFSTITATGTVKVEFGNDGTLEQGTVMTGVDQVVLASGVTTLTGVQANGITFSGTGGTVNITAAEDDGAQTLRGTTGNDTIAGRDGDTVFINQGTEGGGSDTLVFSGSANDFTVTGFNTGTTVGVRDVLDFSRVRTSLENANEAGSAVNVQTYNNTGDITGEIVLFTAIRGPTADAIAAQFDVSRDNAPTLNDGLAGGANDMIFLIAKDASTDPDTAALNVWRWQDSNNDGDVLGTELSLLATLNGIRQDDIQTIPTNNFTL
jgi:hypothetical protein